MQLEGGFGGIRFPHVKGSDSLSFRDYLISATIFVNILAAGPRVPVLLEALLSCAHRIQTVFRTFLDISE